MSGVTGVTGVTGTSGTSGTTDQPTTQLDGKNTQLDRTAFLKLLVAQLKYQDPTNPADTSQMLTQSAQLTMVDRLNEIATSMTSSVSSQQLALGSSMIGKQVTFLDENSVSHTETVTTARVDGTDLILTAGAYTVPMGAVTSISAAPAPESADAA